MPLTLAVAPRWGVSTSQSWLKPLRLPTGKCNFLNGVKNRLYMGVAGTAEKSISVARDPSESSEVP